MKISCGISQTGNLQDSLNTIQDSKLIIFVTTEEKLASHAEELYHLYPNIPTIGCIGMGYQNTTITEHGIHVYGFSDGIEAVGNVIEQVSVMPVKYISRLEQDLHKISAQEHNTICIDICCGHDEITITTLNSALSQKNISLIGGTGGAGKVAFCGKIYEDSCVYALIKNTKGKVKAYKENIYHLRSDYPFFTVTNADPEHNILIDLNGKPAKEVYQSLLNISEKDILTQTFKNPFGKVCGNDIFIISIKDIHNHHGLTCFKRTITSDIITILELDDYQKVVQNTIQSIQKDFHSISGIFSINCLFRYLLFQDLNYVSTYFKEMSKLGTHIGLIGYGEHYKQQHTNQTFSCVVFE